MKLVLWLWILLKIDRKCLLVSGLQGPGVWMFILDERCSTNISGNLSQLVRLLVSGIGAVSYVKEDWVMI